MTTQYTAYWDRLSGDVWVKPVDGGAAEALDFRVTNKNSACRVLDDKGFLLADGGHLLEAKWQRTSWMGRWKLAVRSSRTSLGDAPATSPSTAELRTETIVYPSPRGEPVTYRGCEIDELDSDGNLRIVGTSENFGRAGFEYIVWPSGTFIRAETKRNKVSGDEPSSTSESKTPE
ncbi:MULTISPECIES: hypothetical protein [Mycobacteroides]|uniref:Uncharacterized protein n=1 Tax=Mycobacteroides abscessus subsp. massiliense TaxID=1962118 RepID=A0A1U0Z877_9MYCO|nr:MULTISPECIES: hypothetical protein [Mycobacteroides]MBE5464952.1 hypothetical protein [Mycobacteroides abscessus]NOS08782.1 hypothetical protein [Mycobacteroides abscessus]NOS24534.1 hypothetical protein [Mycobacteroides abscessus]RIR28011.1 hypothetical protein D2E38_26395 [Mycobacteroides abscessus]RIR33298.1 hypothetical protein D2E36_24535 [Mycobacteroides abscessus]